MGVPTKILLKTVMICCLAMVSIKLWQDFLSRGALTQEFCYSGPATATIQYREGGGTTRPYLILHLGPPKTATTSLQTDLTLLNDTLRLDKYIYAGRYYSPSYSEKLNKIVPNREDTRLGDFIREMFKPPTCKTGGNLTDCVLLGLKRQLDQYKGYNVLISDEAYSATFKTPEHFVALRDAVGEEWDVQIVVTYRHFFQWLPSDMFQRYRMDKDKGEHNWKNHWPHEEGPGEAVTLLFPFYYQMWSDLGHVFLDTIIDNVQDTFQVKILNLHHLGNYTSLRSAFLCGILPDALMSCQKSLELDQKPSSASFFNSAQEALHVNYDMLTTGAAELGLVDIARYHRKTIREALRNYTEVQLGRSAWDFDFKCPHPSQLEEFLKISLILEAKIWGKAIAEQLEAETRAAFQQDTENLLFCEVDVSSTVAKEPWKRFFNQYLLRD